MIHSPAFDYNIIQLDRFIVNIKNEFDILMADVKYNQPDSLFVDFIKRIDERFYHIRVFWKVQDKFDFFRVADNSWNIEVFYTESNGIKQIELVDGTKTLDYVKTVIGDYFA